MAASSRSGAVLAARPRAAPEPRLLRVVENRPLGRYRLLVVADPEGATPAPGQFAMLRAAEGWGGGLGERPYLARAYSYADFQEGCATFLLEEVGPGSARLCRLAEGERLYLLGPLGRPFTLPEEEPVFLVGGGTGVAPLAFLARQLGERAEPLLGFRDRASAAAAALFPEPRLATEDGSHGHHGTALELLERFFAGGILRGCGPSGLLEGVRRFALARKVDTELALEAPMACGFGACHGCVVATAEGSYQRVCVEGPVFDAAALAPLLDPPPQRPCYPRRRTRPPLPRPSVAPAAGPVSFLALKLAHPVINGSGTFDLRAALTAFGPSLLDRFPFAAYVSKTITLAERAGNPPPRLYEVAAGLLNSIGLPNPGLARYLAEELPLLAAVGVPLITNVMANEEGELSALFSALSERREVAAVELNVSCPNVHDGLELGANPKRLERFLARTRHHLKKPLIVKLTPNAAAVREAARAAEAGGADGLSLINTVPAKAPGCYFQQGGGLSGPALKAIALAQVEEVARACPLPLVAGGGVQRGADARALLEVGATLVAVGSESFRDPLAGRRIAAELGYVNGSSRSPQGKEPDNVKAQVET